MDLYVSEEEEDIWKQELNKLIPHKCQCHEWKWYYPTQLGQQHKRGDATTDLRYSNQLSMVQVYTMRIDVLKSNIVRHRLITGH